MLVLLLLSQCFSLSIISCLNPKDIVLFVKPKILLQLFYNTIDFINHLNVKFLLQHVGLGGVRNFSF